MAAPFPVPYPPSVLKPPSTPLRAASPTDHGPLPEVALSVRRSVLPSAQLADVLLKLGREGECRHDPDLHTGPDAFEVEPADVQAAREEVAKQVCGGCPVRDLC